MASRATPPATGTAAAWMNPKPTSAGGRPTSHPIQDNWTAQIATIAKVMNGVRTANCLAAKPDIVEIVRIESITPV